MNVVIPGEILLSARLSESELKQEIAVMLFEKDKLTLGQSACLAGMNRLQFQHLLASRAIPVHYDIAQFEHDLASLNKLERI